MRSLLLTTLALTLIAPAAAELSPAQKRIAAAEQSLERAPDDPAAHTRLALAYARRARETAESGFYDKALEAVDRALELRPDDYQAQRLRIWSLLGKHEFAQALEQAQALNRRAPDDLMVYGFLADAYIELGRYAEATEAAQWMLDLRPGNIPGLTRAAYLRELHGWTEGAIEFMRAAYQRTPGLETEDLAWIQTQLAHLERSRGNPDAAEAHLHKAFAHYPDYHYAWAERGRLRLAQDRPGEAAEALEQRYRLAPHPENLFELAEALERAGKLVEARRAFAAFEPAALAESAGWDNANRELIAYYADHADQPDKALALAERDIARRQDVFTRDAYAWALHKTGRSDRAATEMQQALSLGIRTERMRAHAAAIGVAVPQPATAAR